MCDKASVIVLPSIENPTKVCEGYLVGAEKWNLFPTKTWYGASDKLELIHGDLHGPFSHPTLSASKYFFFFVDNFTWVMWVSW